MKPYLVLAVDGDGTLTSRGDMPRTTLRALRRLLEAGGQILLVTGEKLRSVQEFPHVRLFHRVVAENGAVVYDPQTGKHRRLCAPRPTELLPALQAHVRCVSGGEVVMMCQTSHKRVVEKALYEIKSDWRTVLNRRDLLVLPPGISKATGLSAVLEELQLQPNRVVAVGDAQSDIPMIEFCGLGVAVADAVPLLKQAARLVLRHRAGRGVAELIGRMFKGDLPEPEFGRTCTATLDDGGLHLLDKGFRPSQSNPATL
jgi:hydroxymethylpyrimidine pyrophosphatase-like HAD family hydrolase